MAELRRRRMRGIQPRTTVPAEQRFWPKVHKTEDCWHWQASLDSAGYGIFRDERRKMCKAHRFSYELAHGPIPAGLVIDHLCRNRTCVRPDHLEAVTHAENMRRARKTHCSRGHELTPDNVYWVRSCKCCYAARKEERAA